MEKPAALHFYRTAGLIFCDSRRFVQLAVSGKDNIFTGVF